MVKEKVISSGNFWYWIGLLSCLVILSSCYSKLLIFSLPIPLSATRSLGHWRFGSIVLL